LWVSECLSQTLERASGWSRPQVAFKSSHHLWVLNVQAGTRKEPVGGHGPRWSSGFPHVTYGCPIAMLDPEKSQWVVTTPSGLQVHMSLVSVRVPKLDPEKSKCVVTIPSGLQVRMSLVAV